MRGSRYLLPLTAAIATACGAAGLAGGCQLIVGLDPVELYDAGADGSDQPLSCHDGRRNGHETGVDCGGAMCSPCPDGDGCALGSDCQSKVCSGGTCLVPSCKDHSANGNETDVDCGGGCPPCAAGLGCASQPDCESGVCESGSCVANYLWAKTYGDSTSASAHGNAVAVDGAGNAIVAGTYGGTINFGSQPLSATGFSDMFVAKIDPTGGGLWAKSYGNSGGQFLDAVAASPDGSALVVGNLSGTIDFGGGPLTGSMGIGTTGNPFALKLSTAGDHLWSKVFQGAMFSGLTQGVASDGAGGMVLIGNFNGSIGFGGPVLTSKGNQDVFVARLDSAGNHVWSSAFGDSAGTQMGYSVGVDSGGNAIIAGTFTGSVNFGGATLTPPSNSVAVFVAKLSPSGAHLWSKMFGGLLLTKVPAITVAVDPGDNVVVSGGFESTIDFGGGTLSSAASVDTFVAKLDSKGEHLWSKRFGDGQDQSGLATTDATGNVLVVATGAGSMDFGGGALTSAGGSDVFVAKLDPAGKHLWSRRYGGATDDTAGGIAGLGMGQVLVTGTSKGTIDFGGGSLTSAGAVDVFLAKLLLP
jgi:hypothetical protein